MSGKSGRHGLPLRHPHHPGGCFLLGAVLVVGGDFGLFENLFVVLVGWNKTRFKRGKALTPEV